MSQGITPANAQIPRAGTTAIAQIPLEARSTEDVPVETSKRLVALAHTAAPRHVRFVYSDEPVERLAALGERLPPRSADPRPKSAHCDTKRCLALTAPPDDQQGRW
jgi:hypothetical protein